VNFHIKSALISVFNKEGLDPILKSLHHHGVQFFSTGGTQKFIESLGFPCTSVESITGYPSILDGRVKTLHPKIFGGILSQRNNAEHLEQIQTYELPSFDLVMVDLYPFAETVSQGGTPEEIIEKIDIGGISLIRAAAKNHEHCCIVSDISQYPGFLELLEQHGPAIPLAVRRTLAQEAFFHTFSYDTQIHQWFAGTKTYTLRYGENPHQKGYFTGDLDVLFDKLQGKDLSYNNLLDVDSAVNLLSEFPAEEGATFLIVKHNNACGLAQRDSTLAAWKAALECDPVSAFGGVLACNHPIDLETAKHIHGLFFEILIAPHFEPEALELLSSKAQRILLKSKNLDRVNTLTRRSALNGELVQERDSSTETRSQMTTVTQRAPKEQELQDLEFAVKIAKHTKSNTIVLVKNQTLMASGTGQTSRVDALHQAIDKANKFGFDLNGSVMASDAFFPFPDCVEIADKSGISAVVQPGGSVKDALSIDYCNQNNLAMVFTGIRHFKH
jgi:phosphoribosylaminoimidazolecarboxamide formyltransferase/IMP cyclohydrolase